MTSLASGATDAKDETKAEDVQGKRKDNASLWEHNLGLVSWNLDFIRLQITP